jgi:hypothetical protein
MTTRTRGTAELPALAEAWERYSRGEALTSEDLRLVMRVVHAVMTNVDPRPWFYIPLEGAPPSEHRFFVALHVLLLGDPSDKKIRGQVADAWGLKSDRLAGCRRFPPREVSAGQLAEFRRNVVAEVRGSPDYLLYRLSEGRRQHPLPAY